jgi:1-acyl-sn-glycerol-3-phosphate acyltransferase
VDDYGFDPELTDRVLLALARPLYKSWFRVETTGLENVPDESGALVVANHSGTIALDSVMAQVALHDEHPAHRHLRMLGANLVFQTPFVGELARKAGHTLACHPDAERLLAAGNVVGVWPEGFKGIGKPFSQRYKLQRFGRGGFVAAALRTGAPIIPTAIVNTRILRSGVLISLSAAYSGVVRAVRRPGQSARRLPGGLRLQHRTAAQERSPCLALRILVPA